ncbi:MAG: N-acetyltransferase [Planctomycetota bacterium]|nr:MAG: N-acetyltransferase [Planctomycetota bacterium]
MDERLRTPRLTLHAASFPTVDAAAEGNRDMLARLLGAGVPADWPPRLNDDGRMALEGFKFVRDVLRQHPTLVGWWGWWVLLRGSWPSLVGVVATKGPPDREGTVEVSYGIVDSHQGQGIATEAAQGLIGWLKQDPRVRRIVAETFPSMTASIAVMEKCGMSFLGEGSEPGTLRYGLSVPR